MRRVIAHDHDARMVATAIVLDDLRDELAALDEATSAKVRSLLFDVVENTISATRAGEAQHLEQAIEEANYRAEDAHEERLLDLRQRLARLGQCQSLDEVAKVVEDVVAKLGA